MTSIWDDSAFEIVREAAATSVTLEVGDVFKGVYVGPEEITDPNTGKEWTQYLFRAAPNMDGIDEDELCALGGSALQNAIENEDFAPGNRVRLECVKEVETRKGNPYKSLKISVMPGAAGKTPASRKGVAPQS